MSQNDPQGNRNSDGEVATNKYREIKRPKEAYIGALIGLLMGLYTLYAAGALFSFSTIGLSSASILDIQWLRYQSLILGVAGVIGSVGIWELKKWSIYPFLVLLASNLGSFCSGYFYSVVFWGGLELIVIYLINRIKRKGLLT